MGFEGKGTIVNWFKDVFERIGFGHHEDSEIKRLSGGEGTCSVCGVKLKGRNMYKVAGQDKYYCKAHAEEEASRFRESIFHSLPEGMKGKVHFNTDDGYHLRCHSCQKKLVILNKDWKECVYCHEPFCKDDIDRHVCKEKEDAAREEVLAKTPKRCAFCGKKITGASNYHCLKCDNYYCDVHQRPDHHDCKGRQ